MRILLKTTLKLLFRNKGFWFFLIVTPALSILMLNIKVADSSYYVTGLGDSNLLEIESADEKVAYHNTGNGMLIIKVYDASGSELSEYFLESLADNGMFKLIRAKCNGMGEEAFEERIRIDGIEDRMTAAMYLKPVFDQEMLAGKSSEAFEIAILSDDERCKMFETEAGNISERIINTAALLDSKPDRLMELLQVVGNSMPEKEVIELQSPDERSLTKEQNNNKTRMGYVFAFLTLGFMFCGVFVAHTVIQEQKEQVLTRIKLTNAGNITYFMSKFLSGVIVSGILTVVLGIGISFIDEEKLGNLFLISALYNTQSLTGNGICQGHSNYSLLILL